jgi:predicted TIM-barrel fold metal-dependent hydrolase
MTWRNPIACLCLLFAPPVAAAEPAADVHVHLWHGKESLAHYRDRNSRDDVAAGLIGAMWFGGPNQALAGDPVAISAGNDAIIALAAAEPGIVPVGTVHPYDGEAALTELGRIAAKGVRVVKLHPHTQRFDTADPRVLALARRAGDLGITLLFDNASILPGDNQKLFNLALQAPKTNFIFAHMGGMEFRFWNTLKAARTAEGLFGNNINFDISATVALVAGSPIADEFVWTIRNVGVDHVLLGSDYPQYSLAQTLAALDRLDLTVDEKRKIRIDNAKRLLTPAARP